MFDKDIKQVSPFEQAAMDQPIPRKRLLVTGVIAILIGIAAIILPFLTTIAIEFILALILLIAGVNNIIHALNSSRFKGMTMRFLSGILYVVLGLILLMFPMKGALTLTVILAVLFMVSGVFKIAQSMLLKPLQSWKWLFLSGILSFVLGVIIWLALPDAASWVIGLLVGIELVLSGSTMTTYAMSLRHESF